MARYCTNCRKKVADDAQTCRACNKPIGEQSLDGEWSRRPAYFERAFEVRTPWNFAVAIELKGVVTDDYFDTKSVAPEFPLPELHRIVGEWSSDVLMSVLADAFVTMTLLPAVPDPEFFFPPHAKVALYRGHDRGGHKVLEPDIGCRTTLDAANALAKETKWNSDGSTVSVDEMKVLVFQQEIEENYAMLTPEQIELYENHESFGPTIEGVAALVMRHKDQVLKEFNSVARHFSDRTPLLTVNMKGMGRDQTISWGKRDSVLNDIAWQVLGFREEGGFGPNPFDESTDGSRVRVVHSNLDNGETADRLELGRSYYYTFILKNTKRDIYATQWLRFTVIVPTAQELKEQSREADKLQALMEKLAARPVVKKPTTPAEKLSEVADSINSAASFIDAMVGGLSAQQAKWKGQGLTEDDVDDRMSKLKPFFAGKLREILDEIKK